MKNYLITGGAGFIGFWLVKKLSEDNQNKIVVIDNLIKETESKSFQELCQLENVTYLNLDLTNDNLESIPKLNYDVIFHLAAYNGTQNFYTKPYDVIYNSTISTFNLLSWCKLNKPNRFVFASTSESYAGGVKFGITPIPTPENIPLIIDDITNPRWSYATSKINGESAVISASIQYDIQYTIIRFHNVYGPRMGVNHVIPDYLERVKKKKFQLFGGNNTRSFIYIDDAVFDTINLAFNVKSINQIVNIGSNLEISMLDLAKKINSILNIQKDIEINESPEGSVTRRLPNLELIESILGERSRTSLDIGLRNTITYYGL